jgi:hypothetical protein
MHRPVLVAHSSFIEGSHTTKNTASGVFVTSSISPKSKFSRRYSFLTYLIFFACDEHSSLSRPIQIKNDFKKLYDLSKGGIFILFWDSVGHFWACTVNLFTLVNKTCLLGLLLNAIKHPSIVFLCR